MKLATTRDITGLLTPHQPPCVSLYQPTDRAFPGSRENPVRFRNHLRAIETSLKQKYPAREIRPLMEKFEQLAGDGSFWRRRTDGLAVLAAADTFAVFDLPRRVPERVVVAENFHVKPLLRIVQSSDRYQVLCLTRHTAKLYDGNRDLLDAVEPSKVPAAVAEALGPEWEDARQRVADDDGHTKQADLGDRAYVKSSGDVVNQFDKVADRFFRAVDDAVLEHHSRPSGLPLILAAMPQHQATFRELTRNNFLMPDAIEANPEPLSAEYLRRAAWKLMEPHYVARLQRHIDAFHASKSRQLASDDLNDVVKAAVIGRVGMLLVEADRTIPGRIDPNGMLQLGTSDGLVDDVLDDLAELCLRQGAEVVVVPAPRIPSATGLAAVYRF